MATVTRTTRSTTRPAKARKVVERFDGSDSDHWHEIPSKGMLYALAIAAFNGAKFSGSEVIGSREAAKAVITAAKESGHLDEK